MFTLAPCAYKPEKVAPSPSYSFGVKVNQAKNSETPGKQAATT